MSKQSELRHHVTRQIITALENGGLPSWRKTWNSRTKNVGLPRNLLGRLYRGINILLLTHFQEQNGYKSCYFGTYNAVKKIGGQVQKRPENIESGKKWGCEIIFFNSFMKTTRDNETKIEAVRHIPYLAEYAYEGETVMPKNRSNNRGKAQCRPTRTIFATRPSGSWSSSVTRPNKSHKNSVAPTPPPAISVTNLLKPSRRNRLPVFKTPKKRLNVSKKSLQDHERKMKS